MAVRERTKCLLKTKKLGFPCRFVNQLLHNHLLPSNGLEGLFPTKSCLQEAIHLSEVMEKLGTSYAFQENHFTTFSSIPQVAFENPCTVTFHSPEHMYCIIMMYSTR